MVLVRVTYGEQDQVSQTYDVPERNYREVQKSLVAAGVPVGIFYFLNPRRILPESKLDGKVEDQEIYYGVNNSVLLHTSQLFDNLDDRIRVQELLEAGANPNLPDRYDLRTPLYIATFRNLLATVQVLLKFGADPNLPNEYGNTPLFEASIERNLEMVRVLLAAGAIDTPNKGGGTAESMARNRGDEDVANAIRDSQWSNIKEPEMQ